MNCEKHTGVSAPGLCPVCLIEERDELAAQLEAARAEIAKLQDITSKDTCCAYCGAAYPKGTPRFGDNALTEHIKVCPEHPMRECERQLEVVRAELERVQRAVAWSFQTYGPDIDKICRHILGVPFALVHERYEMLGTDELLEQARAEGYAAGATAEQERCIKAICPMCENDEPEYKDGHWIHTRLNLGPGGIYSRWCRAAAIRAEEQE